MYNKNMDYDYGKRLKLARIAAGYTQNDVAEKLGVYQSNVSNWEKNVYRPDYDNLRKLSRLYNESIDFLLFNE